jgi:hypothetical protein
VDSSTTGPVLDRAVVEFIHGGVAVGVATRDEDLKPAFARGWGPEVSADGRSVTLCVSSPQGSRVRANLETNGSISLGFCPPTMAKAVQLKGVAAVLGEPGPEHLGRVERHVSAFRANAEQVGVPPAVAERIFDGSTLVLISVSIDEGFDQTPGPTAGRRL